MRETTAIFLFAVACSSSSLDFMYVHPPTRLAMACASITNMDAAKPRLKDLWLGVLHSKIHILECLTCSTSVRTQRLWFFLFSYREKHQNIYLMLSFFSLNGKYPCYNVQSDDQDANDWAQVFLKFLKSRHFQS